MIEWKDTYAIGVPAIDAQHKRLFEIGNSIYELLENYILDDKYDKIVDIIKELREYTKYHFKSEEEYMIKIKYRHYLDQKVEHDDFVNKLEEIELKDIDENQEAYIRELLVFVFDWILNHIVQKDKMIGQAEKTLG
ncbi:MAG: hemerythrin family protein [Peptococcaceae bacterium]|nr:hemerythrin family protein [Peptococcaceae bacterium]